MVITGLQGLKMWQACLVKGTTESLAEIITDEFVFTSPGVEARTRDKTLKFTKNAGRGAH